MKLSIDESPAGHSPALTHSYLDGPGSHLPPLQMEVLELLHHFTTETCFTLSDRPESHQLWRIVAIQVAFQHDFLMRGILAISALHLSHLRPELHDRYLQIAVQQQDSALASFRSLMSNMDESNCDAFFALSSLVVVYGFESPKNSDSLGMFSGKDADEWLPLIRGVNTVLQTLWPCIKNGRLSSLLHDHKQEPPKKQLPDVLVNQLANLENLCENASDGPAAVDAYRLALANLRACFSRMNNKQPYECEVSITFLWPVIIPQEFLTLLNLRRPEALIILAHYCIILHHLDNYWWMKGWARHIVENIDREIPDDWRYWIQLPKSAITVPEKVWTNSTLPDPISGNGVSNDFDAAIDQSIDIQSQGFKDA